MRVARGRRARGVWCWLRPFIWLVLLAAPLAALGARHVAPETVVAEVNGEAITVATLAVFVRAAQRRDADLAATDILAGLVENRVLSAAPAPATAPVSAVAYDAESQREQQRFALIRAAFDQPLQRALRATGAQTGLDFLVQPLNLSAAQLAPLLTLKSSMRYAFTPEQQRAAADYVVARYQLAADQAVQDLTLWELYRRQNIQLKVQMHNLNLAFIEQAINQFLGVQFVLNWFAHASPLDSASRAAVLRCIDDAMARERTLAAWGLMREQHDDNPPLARAAAAVSAADIAAYYERHPDQFQRVEKVRARHIQLASQAQADAVYAQLQAGLAFSDAVRRFSTAADAAQGGELGWIARADGHSDWLRAVAFVQPAGQFSRPVRSPAQAGGHRWEIVTVDQRHLVPQPLASESVRYRAARAVAREQLASQFHRWLAAAKTRARVRINTAAVAQWAAAGDQSARGT